MANKVKTELSLDTARTIANLQKLTDTLNQTATTLNKTSSSFSNIKKAIDNNTSVMNKTANLYKAANKEFKDTGKELKNVTEKSKETSKAQKSLGTQTKDTASGMAAAFGEVGIAVSATIGIIKSIASTIGQLAKKIEELVKPQAEYIEDLNFLDNAYGEANNSGKQLLDTLNQMVGYDPTTLVKSTAIFRQMGNALDMDAKVADKLANNLTKLTVDVKSITGQDLQRVASKFQSAMAGNIRAVRAYGVDVTQAALQQELLRLGIDRKISSLNRAEKSILTYIAMERQLSTANGDLSRTVNSVGNQWEIFKNQITQLGRLIGGFFIPILKAILPVLNGIIMALNTIISLVMSFFGIDAESFSQEFGSVSSGVDDLSDSFDDMADSASKAGKSAKEAQKSLRGFDKLNNITTPTSSSGSGGGGSSSGKIGGIDPKLLSFLDDYNLHLEDMNNWATKIRDKIMEWLGFTKIVDEVTGKVTYKFGGIGKLIENIRNTIKGIFNSPFGDIYTYLVGLGGPLNFIIVHLGKILATNDEVWNHFKEAIQTAFDTIQPLFDFFTETVIPGLGAAFDWLYQNVIKPFSDFIDGIFTSVWEDTLLPVFDRFNKELLPVLIETFEELWNNVISPGADLLANVLKPVIDTIIGVLDVLWKNVLSPLINFIVNTVFDVIKNNVLILKTVFIPIADKVIDILMWLWKNVLGPIVNFLKNNVINTINVVTTYISGVINFIRTTFNNIIEFIKDVFTGNWEGALSRIRDIFKNMFKPITDTIAAVKKGLEDLGKGASNIGGSIWNGVKGLFGAANGGIWNSGIWSPVKTYAGGGFPSRGEIFMARETKGPELVGRIGSSTAVLNNDQILEQMTIAVARGMAASNKQQQPVNIIAEADTEGLLNFIQFKNASKNRQYGL